MLFHEQIILCCSLYPLLSFHLFLPISLFSNKPCPSFIYFYSRSFCLPLILCFSIWSSLFIFIYLSNSIPHSYFFFSFSYLTSTLSTTSFRGRDECQASQSRMGPNNKAFIGDTKTHNLHRTRRYWPWKWLSILGQAIQWGGLSRSWGVIRLSHSASFKSVSELEAKRRRGGSRV